MTAIVGVHGIGKQQLGRHQLAPLWTSSLRDGLERASGGRVGEPPLDLAFYGDAFMSARGAKSAAKGPTTDSEEWLGRLEGEELEDLIAAATEAVTAEGIEVAESSPSKAYTRVPKPLQVVLRGMDQHFGPSAGALYLGALRQVRRYLRDSDLKTTVDAAVKADVTQDCRVLIGHSLGSVVAFEYIRQNPAHRLDLLVTVGSPLGLRMVRGLMPNPRYGAIRGLPVNVAAWANIRDLRDPVACAGDLHRWWPGVNDRPPVDNEGDAHSVARYLGKRETGSVLLGALPELAS